MIKFSEIQYKRPDYAKVKEQISTYAKKMAAASDYSQLKQCMQEQDEMQMTLLTQTALAFVRAYQDCTDEFYQQEMVYNEGNISAIDPKPLQQALLNSPYREELVKEYGEMILKRAENQNRISQGGFEEKAKDAELIAQYQQLKASLKFDYEGREVSEGEIRKLSKDQDPEVRRAARLANARGFLAHKKEFEDILDQMIHNRIEIAKANGFDSYLDFMNIEKGRYSYGEKELNEFCRLVKQELVPMQKQVFEKIAARLGLEHMTIFDTGVYFKEGNPLPAGDANYLMKQASKMYHDMSEELGELFDEMVANEYIDCLQSEHKISGMGFATQIPGVKMPFIFGNCNGTGGDVDVLVHEFGHAYQMKQSMLKFELQDYQDMPNDLAEVPSKTMEQLAYDYEDLFFGDKKEQYVEAHIIGVLEEICSFCMTHEYETYLYSNPEASNEEREAKYIELLQEYNDGVDPSDLLEYMKQGSSLFSNMGVYMFPRYLISYALSNLCAISFRCLFDEDKKKGLALYEKLCSLGGSLDYNDAMKAIGMVPAYQEEALQEAKAYFKRRLNLK